MRNAFIILIVLSSVSAFAGTCKTSQSQNPEFDGGIFTSETTETAEDCSKESQSYLGESMYENGVEKIIKYSKFEFENEKVISTGTTTLK